ncbi:hypothetical protein [Streptomyces gilvus]|uniref:hypothetical protein n=1 Tax=Streptomyces gilvus TaxID=2920937 RepID=UPI001F113926|nr:hypothetical protein [Streptomyces sp. CME 23]MCH5677800.1 hypothetical protein [Streptomyces sp. CME 23]
MLVPQVAQLVDMSEEQLKAWIGTLAPARAVRIQRACPLAIFDRYLRHLRDRLPDGPSRAFPDVRYSP